MSLRLFLRKEQAGRFNNIFCTNLAPLQVGGIALSGYTDNVAVYDELRLLNVCLDSAIEDTVHRVILQHVCQVVYRAKVVDSNNLHFFSVSLFERSAENETTDTAKSVNTNFNHLCSYF